MQCSYQIFLTRKISLGGKAIDTLKRVSKLGPPKREKDTARLAEPKVQDPGLQHFYSSYLPWIGIPVVKD